MAPGLCGELDEASAGATGNPRLGIATKTSAKSGNSADNLGLIILDQFRTTANWRAGIIPEA
jgi:hypothetical protein